MLPSIIYLGYVKFLYPLCLVNIGEMLCCKSHFDLEYFHFFLGGSTYKYNKQMFYKLYFNCISFY